MSHRSVHRRSTHGSYGRPSQRPVGTLAQGQALIEYALILALLVVSLAGVLAITGPAVGGVFSRQVLNLLGGDPDDVRTPLPNEAFWTQVAAVASYTPQSAKVQTNTPRPTTLAPDEGGATEEPVDPPPDTLVPTDTPIPTAGPSPTPTSAAFGYPFNDPGDNADRWETGITSPPETATWTAMFWNYVSSGYNNAGNCRNSNFNSAGAQADNTARWTTSYDTLDFVWSGSPGGSITNEFCARFKTTMDLDAGTYTWELAKDDGIRVWVDGVKVVDANIPNPGDAVTWNWEPLHNSTFRRSFTVASSGPKPIVIEMYDNASTAEIHVKLLDTAETDIGTCNWALSPVQYHSGPDAWNDSPTGNYAAGSLCSLKLRGDINLTGATAAELEFWDRYTLSANTRARAEVRVVGQTSWTALVTHQGASTMGWSRQLADLSGFTGQTIELRFVLDATSATTTAEGWVIDDISVRVPNPNVYSLGFFDNMEGASHWLAGDTWARSNESTHQGLQAWSDSPGAGINYAPGTNAVLELDGVVKLSLNPDVTDPEVAFWHHYALGTGDSIRLEVSTDHQAWLTLGSVLATATTNNSWTQQIVSLSDYAGDDIYLRFRLEANNDGSIGNGWWIDDFTIRAPVDTAWDLGSCDNVESGQYWVANGTWGIVTGTDTNTGTGFSVQAHGGSSFWSDSPGASYAQGADDALEMIPWLSLPVGSVAPELVFWHQWGLGTSDYVAVEILRESTGAWTELWRMTYGQRPPHYNTNEAVSSFYSVLSWQRETVDLSSFISNTERYKIRFRRYSNNTDTRGDGWWIDDVCFQSHTDTTRSLPFTDAMNSASNWYTGGTWWVSPEQSHDGIAFSDSLGTSYNKYANGILELRHVINLTGTTWPTLYYWDRHELGTKDVLKVEISVLDEATGTWGSWFEIDQGTPAPQPDVWYRTVTTTSWNRHQGNLNAYVDRKIRLRFRLHEIASNKPSTEVGDGWWIDQVSIIERYNRETVFSGASFLDDGDVSNTWWVMDGTWARVPGSVSGAYTNIGSGSGLGAGTWTAQYYTDTNNNNTFTTAGYRGTAEVESIDSFTDNDLECSPAKWRTSEPGFAHPCGVGLTSDDQYLIRWTRTISVSQTTKYRLQLQSDDGLRVFVDGTSIYNYWSGRSFNTPPDTAEITLTPGSHEFVIEFFEDGGSARVKVDFEVATGVYSDSPAGNYVHGSNASMTLEGVIDLAGLSNPTLRFSQNRARGNSDTFYVEVSTNGGYTWNELTKYIDNQSWTSTDLSLSAYVGQRINIRFRLDARTNTGVADGWTIDNIRITGS